MSLQSWQLEAQKKFKEFKRSEKLIGECVDLNYTVNTYEEHWDLKKIDEGDEIVPQRFRLFAGRFFCKVETCDKKIINLGYAGHSEPKEDSKPWPLSPVYQNKISK